MMNSSILRRSHHRCHAALSDIEECQHQIKSICDHAFRDCESDEQLQSMLGSFHISQAAAGLDYSYQKKQNEQRQAYTFYCSVDLQDDMPYASALATLWRHGQQ